MCSSSQLLKEELKHLDEVLTQCKYPRRAIQKIQREQKQKKNKKSKERNTMNTERCHIVVLYTKDYVKATSPSVASMESRHTSRGNTLKNLLIFPKDKDEMKKQSNTVYWYKCGRTECNDEYIGESARTFEERFKEHLKAPSPINEHDNITGHKTSVENFKIIGREGHWYF